MSENTRSASGEPYTVFISSFAPEDYQLLKSLPVTIRQVGETYMASFVDANVNASGNTQSEAQAHLKELILDLFDRLNALHPARLGPGPKRQLAVLRDLFDAGPDHERGR